MHIYNRKTKKLNSFSTVSELIEFCAQAAGNQKSNLYFWNFGCPGWRLASEILTDDIIKNKSFEMPDFPPDLDEQITVRLDPVADGFKVIEIASEGSKDTLAKVPVSSKPVDYAEQRRFKRYEARLKVIVSNKQKTFLSYSKNISEGGILVEDRIPNYMFNEESEIYISAPNKKEIIVFRCLPIGDEENPNRIKFQHSQDEYIEKLKIWLEGPAKKS